MLLEQFEGQTRYVLEWQGEDGWPVHMKCFRLKCRADKRKWRAKTEKEQFKWDCFMVYSNSRKWRLPEWLVKSR